MERLRKIYERAQSKMLSRVDEKFLFIFDPSEIVKPFAEKMEGLSKVRDASDKPRYTYTKIGKKVELPNLKSRKKEERRSFISLPARDPRLRRSFHT